MASNSLTTHSIGLEDQAWLEAIKNNESLVLSGLDEVELRVLINLRVLHRERKRSQEIEAKRTNKLKKTVIPLLAEKGFY